MGLAMARQAPFCVVAMRDNVYYVNYAGSSLWPRGINVRSGGLAAGTFVDPLSASPLIQTRSNVANWLPTDYRRFRWLPPDQRSPQNTLDQPLDPLLCRLASCGSGQLEQGPACRHRSKSRRAPLRPLAFLYRDQEVGHLAFDHAPAGDFNAGCARRRPGFVRAACPLGSPSASALLQASRLLDEPLSRS